MMSIRDAALATGLTPKALRRRVERGTLASVFVDNRRMIPMDELLRQGLLVPLDGARPPRTRRAGAPGEGEVGTRLSGVEQRLAAQEQELAALRKRISELEAAARSNGNAPA